MARGRSQSPDVLRLTDEVKRLNYQTEKLSDCTIEIDKRVVRLETMVELAQKQPPKMTG